MSLPDDDMSDVMGAQEPRLRLVPDYVSSAGPEVCELCALAGLCLDPWELLILIDALGERANGKWAAFEVGTVVPRQNGKGTILEARELAGLFLFGEKLLIHSAHEQSTSSEHFRRLLQLIEGVPEFDRRVLKAPKGKGAEAIELRGGQRIFFKTRTGGGARGLTGDFVALDEAMILPAAMIAALVPTMAARSIHGNPQLWYAGSAVDRLKHEHGVTLARLRQRALKGAAGIAYFEHSAEGDNPDHVPESVRTDPRMWAIANPGLGIRISAEHIKNECEGALGPREFAVERLGIGDWPPTEDVWNGKIAKAAWLSCVDLGSVAEDPVCLAFDVTPTGSHAAIAAAGARLDGKTHVEIVEHRPGTAWLPERIAELQAAHEPKAIVCDPKSPAAALLPALGALDVEVYEVSGSEYAQGCGMLESAVTDDAGSRLCHLGTSELAGALACAEVRSLGDAWAWSRRSSGGDICPLVSVTLALWGQMTRDVASAPMVEVFG